MLQHRRGNRYEVALGGSGESQYFNRGWAGDKISPQSCRNARGGFWRTLINVLLVSLNKGVVLFWRFSAPPSILDKQMVRCL